MLLMIVVQAFQTAWGPFSLAIYKQPDANITYNWVLKGFTITMCILVLLLAAVANPVIIFLASKKYMGASVVVFPLAMGLIVQAISWITEIGVGISKKSYLNFYSYFAYVSVTLIAINVFVSTFGLLGVAVGVMTGHFAKSITASFLAQRAYPLPWSFLPVILTLTATLIIGFIGVWLNNNTSTELSALFYLAGAFVVFILGWYLLFTKKERNGMIFLFQTRFLKTSKINTR
jgi:O-antigen/teichoic acid export membrane protein